MITNKKHVYSPIKWSGSKRLIAYKLAQNFPDHSLYIEPFIGSGATLPFRKSQAAIASDIIPELIGIWKLLQENPEKLIETYTELYTKFAENRKIYYTIREEFNKDKTNYSYFLFIVRTAINGQIRYNKSGDFNSAVAYTRNGMRPENLAKLIKEWSEYLVGVDFRVSNYLDVTNQATDETFLFFDPPYSSAKNMYYFGEFDFTIFFNELERLNSIGAKWMCTLDGITENRDYDIIEIPEELYKTRWLAGTNNQSAMNKVNNRKLDKFAEYVYQNYELSN